MKASFAKIEIPVTRDLSLMGYEFRHRELAPGNDGVRDPLYVRVLKLEDGEKPAVMVSCDVAVFPTDIARALRRDIAEKAGTTVERVILAAIHTHSAPCPLNDDNTPNDRVITALRTTVLEAVGRTLAVDYPVELRVQEAPLGLGYNRRVPTGDSVKHAWNIQQFPGRDPGPATDPTFTLLEFRQTNGPRRFLLWSVGVHPVVLGQASKVISADYPGNANALIEHWLPDARPMFFLGAAGDTHPWIATQEDPENIKPVARAAASFACLLAEGTRPVQGSGVRGQESGERILAATSTMKVTEKLELDLVAWKIGDVTIATTPVELFGGLARRLREQVDGPVFLCTVTNGWGGYLPTEQAFPEGEYEVPIAERSGFKPGDGERMIDEMSALVRGL